MADGRGNYETKEVVKFGGLNASSDPSKDSFPEYESPSLKNVLNTDQILEARPGRVRINSTRYNNEITSICSYTDRSNVAHTVFSVKTVATDPTDPDGTIQETH